MKIWGMKQVLCKTMLVFLCLGAGKLSAWGQTYGFGQKRETYHFGQPAKEVPRKLPKAVPGRVHLLDGSSRSVPLAYVDYNQVFAVENGVETKYTQMEISSFVMKQDSFIVLRDFKVTEGADEQEFRSAFVQVGAVGAGFALYQFKGTMRRDDAVHYGSGTIYNGSGWAGVSSKSVSQVTEYEKTSVWFTKRDNDPRWLSLPKSGKGIRAIVEPIIADDKQLSDSVRWAFLKADDVQDILVKYLANKAVVKQ